MIDIGARLSRRPGAHLKNAFLYQRDIDLFASVIRGHLHALSVPTNNRPLMTLNPHAFNVDYGKLPELAHNNQNPEQNPRTNLPGAAVTYAVGGMATHWTCATPRHHPTVERSEIFSALEWDHLYSEAEALLNTHTDQFEGSIRHNLVREVLQAEYAELLGEYAPRSLPLAVERRRDNPELVHWSGSDTVLGRLAEGRQDTEPFILEEQHRCTLLVPNRDGTRIEYAEVQNLMDWRTVRVYADTFVVCCNAYLTPQLLYNSRIRPPLLGRFLTEQPMTFCQIVLQRDLVETLVEDARFEDRIQAHRERYPDDPIPIPLSDPEPQVWIPVSEERPWHCQIHRDAFHYGDVAPSVDGRLIVDLRWFGIVEPCFENRITFSDSYTDAFDMPQPTFEWVLSGEDRRKQHWMMKDMLRAASALGGFLPGSEPQFVAPGLPIHVTGTTRMGSSPDESVVDASSRVWGVDNLYLGGNGLIPRGSASNPTLTTVAIAIKGAEHITANAGKQLAGAGRSGHVRNSKVSEV
jgi:pyranose oxidase